MSILRRYLDWRHNHINQANRKRLINKTPTLICSNCTGGVLYHWLGLEFRSPFINLYMDNDDFLTAMENFEEFINGEVLEDLNSSQDYPIGIGIHGEVIHFMHYPDFGTAITKWNERKKRIDVNNMAIMLTNFGVNKLGGGNKSSVIQRFRKLKFKNKLLFSGEHYEGSNIVWLKGYSKVADKKNIFGTQSILGKRYIDQFDYVDFINNLI